MKLPSISLNRNPLPRTLTEDDKACALQIRSELNNGPKRKFANIKGDFLAPKSYFSNSEFWDYAPSDAFDDWHYCISKLQSKTEIISLVFIGAISSLVDELCDEDYEVKSNEHYALHNNSLHLLFKDKNFKEKWKKVSTNELGLEHQRVPFTRIISVVKNAEAETVLRRKLQEGAKAECQYPKVKEHLYVQLRDLPKDESERKNQFRQWTDLTKKFPTIFKMIDSARIAKEPILIHCTAGRHRSVAILVAYLVARLGLTVPEAYDYIRSQRGCAVHYERAEFSQWLTDWARKAGPELKSTN